MTNQASLPATDSTAFRFYLLGELRIERRFDLVSLPPHRTHSLLAALLLQPHRQRRDRLVGLLFPDSPEQIGRRRLSDLLWLLRHSLPELPLDARPQDVCLPAESRWLDVEAFRRAAAGPDPDAWLEAMGLYQGDLLEGLYEDWLLEEREALVLEHIRLLHRASTHLIQQRRFEEVLPLAERLVQAEPYDEQALRGLMQAYREVGRRGAALAAYERFVTLAADELGAEPEPATHALAEAIRCGGSGIRPEPAPPLSAAASPGDLLRHAQVALVKGDKETAEDCLQLLQTLPAETGETGFRLLEIDMALFYEEYDLAGDLLASCDPSQAPVLVRRAQLALERRQAPAASEAASEALVLAHESGDRQSELEAVLVLAKAQRQLGQGVQAARSAEQALSLARDCASQSGIAQALLMKGHSQFRQGRYAQALSLYHEARSLAHEQGLNAIQAEALHWIAWVQSYQGALLDALVSGRAALSIWRDIGLPGREASTLQNLAYTYAQLGRTTESLHALEQAQQLCEALGEPVRAAVNQYHLADTLLYQDEALASQAIAVAQAALSTFRTHDQPGWEAATLTTEGRAYWLSEQHEAALAAFERAYTIYEKLGELAFLPELLAFQGLAHLGLEGTDAALACTRRALLSLAQGEVSEEAVSDVYFAHALALAARGEEEQAHTYLVRAYENLLSAATQLEDETARQAFFHHNPTTRRLMQEVYGRGIASPPLAGVVIRRLPASRGGRSVPVSWTVDAGPPDVALKQAQGAIALRRARLARLMQEAQAQGANPTAAQLADALGVSKRTIQRDLAIWRREQ